MVQGGSQVTHQSVNDAMWGPSGAVASQWLSSTAPLQAALTLTSLRVLDVPSKTTIIEASESGSAQGAGGGEWPEER